MVACMPSQLGFLGEDAIATLTHPNRIRIASVQQRKSFGSTGSTINTATLPTVVLQGREQQIYMRDVLTELYDSGGHTIPFELIIPHTLTIPIEAHHPN
jgi:hypothetical protein